MKTIITITYEGSLEKLEKAFLAQLLADALDAFVESRGPTAEDHMMRKWQKNPALPVTPEYVEYKVKEINLRTKLAGKLHDAVLKAKVEEEKPVPTREQLPCKYCLSPIGESTNEFCSEECTLQHDREAYEEKA